MLSEVAGKVTLPEVSGVVEPVVLVEVVWDVRHAQKYKEHPGCGPEQPGAFIVILPVLCPADQVVDKGRGTLADIDGCGKIEGVAVEWIMFLWNGRAVRGRHRRCVAGSALLMAWWWAR